MMNCSHLLSFSQADGLLNLTAARVLIDEADHEGVRIAAEALAGDLDRVTRRASSGMLHFPDELPRLDTDADSVAIIVGCVDTSRPLKIIEEAGKLSYTSIRGKWETFLISVVDEPLRGCHRALVIAGSDKRSAIYGAYTLSEQIGVSPWHWWADVPAKHHPEIYALPVTTVSGEPSIRYRGIFINDEAPALTGWVRKTFGGYNVGFYKKVFELLLRLRANFLWPAMWPGYPTPGASFFTDDPENQRTADAWGIVVSTSHHEPMQRLSNEWLAENPLGTWDWLTNKEKITDFFAGGVERAREFESYLTMGMRGEYDTKMRAEDPAAIVRDVLQTQRSLIKDVHGREDAVPQLLAVYKEVQEQYDGGRLDVPDDVTLLFSDDNFGSIRRLPRGDEKGRRGGSGVYYHFEYVGTPRSYKWINSNSLGKTWHQLQEAHRRGARQIWVFNVGDIKPLEVPLTFAMNLAWDINSIRADGLPGFFSDFASRTFEPDMVEDMTKALHEHDRLVSMRRHEHIEPTTFSLLHYNEADSISTRWKHLLALAESIHGRGRPDQKPALFQLVLHPIKASAILTALQTALAANQLHARQRRTSANALARRALALFDADFDLSEGYHGLLGGKWDGVMCQPHLGFGDTWHAPSRDMIGGLCYVQARQRSNPAAGNVGVMVEGHEGVRPGLINENSDFTHPSRGDLVPGLTLGVMTRYGPQRRWFEVYSRGTCVLDWSVEVVSPEAQGGADRKLKLSRWCGTAGPGEGDQRVEVEIRWDAVPVGFDEEIVIALRTREGGDHEEVHLPVDGRRVPENITEGFVESDGHVSMPATACNRIPSSYRAMPDIGRSALGSLAVDPEVLCPEPDWLVYRFYIFSDPAAATRCSLALYFNMTLDLDPDHPMEYEVAIDDGPTCRYPLLDVGGDRGDAELPSPAEWVTAVQDCVWRKWHDVRSDVRRPGEHVLKLRLLHTNMLLETIVLDLGGVKESYLGPPPSFRLGAQQP